MAAHNALNGNREKSSSLIIPRCTYTDPEIARIGLNEAEAREKGIAIESVTVEMGQIDRAVAEGQTEGFVTLYVREGQEEIVGATLMAANAGDMISELSVAMSSGKAFLTALLRAIHPFPTQAEILRIAAEELVKKRKAPAMA